MATVFTKRKASELNIGSIFKLSARKNGRQFVVHRDFEGLGPMEIGGPRWKGSVPPHLKGKLLIIVQNCRQLILDQGREVYVAEIITTP